MGAPFDATVALAEQAALPFAQFVLPADHASQDVRGAERKLMYTCISDLAACCADSWRYEPLLTRSSLTS
jgi:hypothetical protein